MTCERAGVCLGSLFVYVYCICMCVYLYIYVNVLCYICKCIIVYMFRCRDLYIGRSPVDQCFHVLLNKYVLHQLDINAHFALPLK